MNQNEKRESMYFPKALDQAVTERFGVYCHSSLDIFGTGTYTTVFEAKDKALKQRIEDFIAGYKAGNIELRERLHSLSAQPQHR